MKLYLDEDLSPVIAGLLRRRGMDVTAAQEVGNVQWDDRAQFAYAARERRALVTANVADFIELAQGAIATNTEHAGILLVASSFRGDEFQAIADAIVEAVKPCRTDVAGSVLYVSRT